MALTEDDINKIYENLRKEGCEFGRNNEKRIKDLEVDMNGIAIKIEKKLGNVNKMGWAIVILLISTMGSMIVGLVILVNNLHAYTK